MVQLETANLRQRAFRKAHISGQNPLGKNRDMRELLKGQRRQIRHEIKNYRVLSGSAHALG